MTRYTPPTSAELDKIERVLRDEWVRPHEAFDPDDEVYNGPPPLNVLDALEADRLAKIKD